MARYLPPSHDASAPGAARGCVDSLVQGSLVDLFAAYGIAAAPLPRMAGQMVSELPEISFALSFKCESRQRNAGKLTFSVPTALLDHMKSDETASVRLDWARELANQLLGRIKNRLLPFATRLDVGNPSVVEPRQLRERLQAQRDLRVYAARTVRGIVLVTLEGLPNDAELKYVGPGSAAEGALLWL